MEKGLHEASFEDVDFLFILNPLHVVLVVLRNAECIGEWVGPKGPCGGLRQETPAHDRNASSDAPSRNQEIERKLRSLYGDRLRHICHGVSGTPAPSAIGVESR